ncbi:MAG: SRPBCC family protein, partial [Solirubrobacteraceae bacterium]
MTVADYGVLIRRDERAILEYRRRYDHPPERVWRALTEPGELAAWFPTTIDGERAPGAALTFRFEQLEIDPFHGEMVAFEPPSLLELTWGPDRLRFALAPDGDGTMMTFTVVLEELGKATRDGAGWHQSLEGLKRVLAGAPARPGTHDAAEWRSLRDAYAERFGPEASVLGPPQEWEDELGAA